MRGGALLVGLTLLMLFLLSAARAALVNRHRGDWLAHAIGRLVCSVVSRLAATRTRYDAVQDVLAWILPLYILALIVTWFLLVQLGFALILWSTHVEAQLLPAVLASGSALSTLGFLTPPGAAGQLLAVLEGAMGLGVVVFFFTFIPGYQAAIQTRELKVAWLYARSGVNPSSMAFVEWLQRSGNSAAASEVWEAWEEWFRLLAETVAIAPVLSIVPTLHRRQSWLIAAMVVLDAASFCLATLEGKGLASASVCHATGTEALRLVAAKMSSRQAIHKSAAPLDSCADFDAMRGRMKMLGAPLRADEQRACEYYLALRKEYAVPLAELAATLRVPVRSV